MYTPLILSKCFMFITLVYFSEWEFQTNDLDCLELWMLFSFYFNLKYAPCGLKKTFCTSALLLFGRGFSPVHGKINNWDIMIFANLPFYKIYFEHWLNYKPFYSGIFNDDPCAMRLLNVVLPGCTWHHLLFFFICWAGLYYYPKDKSKTMKDLVCLATFEVNDIYLGLNWKKKYKAPSDYCFAIKHPRLQQPKSVKFIKFLCAEDKATLERWMVAMRIAKVQFFCI